MLADDALQSKTINLVNVCREHRAGLLQLFREQGNFWRGGGGRRRHYGIRVLANGREDMWISGDGLSRHSAQRVMNFRHGSGQRLELLRCFSAPLDFALKFTENCVKGEPALLWDAPANGSQSTQAALMVWRTVERRATLTGGHLLKVIWLGMAERMLLSLLGVDGMLLGGVYIVLAEQTLDSGSDFVMDNCLVVFPDDIDAKFDYIVGVELKRRRFYAFMTEPGAIYKCSV